jgi:hypothetical protein
VTVVDVASWGHDEDNPVFPVGSQPKRLLICPNPAPTPDLIPDHRYLFKVPPAWKAHQIWSEVIAYKVGNLIGVPVPRCFVARGAGGEVGALVEFFYGYPDTVGPVPRFVHGSDMLQRFIIDKKIGRPHSVRLNVIACRALHIPNAVEWWGKTLMLDALIGNTDRHPDNWGVLVRRDGKDLHCALAPAFDNGTSLGYEMIESRILQQWDDVRLNKYLDRGTHHCGWKFNDMSGGQHVDLCKMFAQTYPDAGIAMRDMLRFAADEVIEACRNCESLEVENRFTPSRSRLVMSLIEGRRNRLAAALGA